MAESVGTKFGSPLDGDGVGVGDPLGLPLTETEGVGVSDAVGETVGPAVGDRLTPATDEQPASTTAAAANPLSQVWRSVTPE